MTITFINQEKFLTFLKENKLTKKLFLPAVNNGRILMPTNFFVSRFTQAHVNAGQIQYLHNGALSIRDSIVFNVSIGKQMIGPYTLFINIVDDKVISAKISLSVFTNEL